MPRLQQLVPLLRPLAAPRAITCRQHFRFSTASRLCAENPIKSSKPTASSRAPPPPPTTPQEASRAADLAAAEAVTESDSAQPPEPKPELPSDHSSDAAFSYTSTQADNVPTPPRTTSKPNTESALKKSALNNATNNNTPPPLSLDLPPPRYHVSRSNSNSLPVYTDFKRGGNLHLTTVRKITGDLAALRDELGVFLKKKKEVSVTINYLTQQVVVKGHHQKQIMSFLEARGM
ncbi:hypothetical protein CC86DRAFT_369655 [Ophiobolus disseminans]|uniref:Large ribosomal subunit protein mL49 n=1 Tax=Ophiobolus disseminans TaxID=1469910 RepID=A0A6A7A4P9_9PLEO|nr:hypothetical protein CC86DRAFT_369655 [Ophiobolus disseminans]